MSAYECTVCGFVYDESTEGTPWENLDQDWVCPVCAAEKDFFESTDVAAKPQDTSPTKAVADLGSYLSQWKRSSDELEPSMVMIHEMAVTGESVVEAMRTRRPVIAWEDILFKGAQLARLPLNEDVIVNTRTTIGPKAAKPLVIETPIYVSHMSFGALSREVKIAMAKGSAVVQTAMCSGEGGILPDSIAAAHRYIFEYVPNLFSVTEENLRAADAIEIKFGQSAKPGMGGHLPGEKVTEEISAVRGFPVGEAITSPAHFEDILDAESLAAKVNWLREISGGRPIGIKVAAGHIEADLAVALDAKPDFITVDGRAGSTGAALKVVKDSTSIPTIYAVARARRFLDERGAEGVSLVMTGGFRVSSDIAKALAMGADAVAVASAAMIACGCQQYRVCHTGRCPVGIATQDPELRARLHIELSARRLANFLQASTEELSGFARLAGHNDVHGLSVGDLCTTSTEISRFTEIQHVGEPEG